MKVATMIPNRIKKKFLNEILDMYSKGELSAGRAAEMLGISRAEFYRLLAETNTTLPKKLNESIRRELKSYLKT